MSRLCTDQPGQKFRVGSGIWWAVPLIAACVASAAMLQHGLIANGDWHVHVFRLSGFVDALKEGAWRPMWHADANAGYGAPTFLFYQPASYFLTALVMTAGLSVEWAWKFVFLIILLGTAEGARRLFMHGASARNAALLAALFVLSPVVLFPVYQTNMPAHALGFMLMPWLFHSALVERSHPGSGAARVATVLALQIVSHPFLAMQALLVLTLLATLDALVLRRRQLMVALGTAVGVAALATAWYWLPVLVMRQLVHWDYLMNPAWVWHQNLLFARPQPSMGAFLANRTFFDVAAVAALSAAALAITIGCRRRIHAHSAAFPVCAGVVFLLMTPVGLPLVELLPALGYLQFAWRWLGLLTLLALTTIATGSGGGSCGCREPVPERTKTILAVVPLLAMLPTSMAVTGVMNVQTWTGMSLQRADSAELQRAETEERWPTLEMRPRSMGRSWDRDPTRDPMPLLFSSNGTVRLNMERRTQHAMWIAFSSETATTLRLRHIYFPGWVASIDDIAVPIRAEEDSGAMLIDLPAGAGELRVRFKASAAVQIGAAVSVLGLFLLLILACIGTTSRRGRPRGAPDKRAEFIDKRPEHP